MLILVQNEDTVQRIEHATAAIPQVVQEAFRCFGHVRVDDTDHSEEREANADRPTSTIPIVIVAGCRIVACNERPNVEAAIVDDDGVLVDAALRIV